MTDMKPKNIKLSKLAAHSNCQGSKRCFVPFEIEAECPNCGTSIGWDGDEEYLSYPNAGSAERIVLVCQICEEADERLRWKGEKWDRTIDPIQSEFAIEVIFDYHLALVPDED